MYWLFHRFDVVHVHTERANFGYGLSARAAGARVVRTIHNAFDYVGPLRLLRSLQRRMLAALGVTHVSIGATVKEVERRVLFNATELVPNWFDVQRFRPAGEAERLAARAGLGIDPAATVLTLVGNCSDIKNHKALFHALASLPSHRGVGPLLLHVGSGAQEDEEKQLVARLGLETRVRFLGALPSPLTALHAADAFVMCSLKEGFSIAVLEAMGCGLPQLLTDVAGLCDIRDITPAVVWAPAPAAVALRDAVISLLDRLPELARSARQSSDRVVLDYGPGRGVQHYARLYRAR